MKPASEQWFVLYVWEPGEVGVKVDSETGAISVGWTKAPVWRRESDTEHVHHPDFYHPDPRVRVAHNRAMLREGVALAACGKEHDPRLRFIETDKPTNPCAACLAATEKAAAVHAEYIAARTKLSEEAAKKRAEEDAAILDAIEAARVKDAPEP